MKFMPWSVWRRDYSTFDSGEWDEDKRFAHKDLAEEYMRSLAGWLGHGHASGGS